MLHSYSFFSLHTAGDKFYSLFEARLPVSRLKDDGFRMQELEHSAIAFCSTGIALFEETSINLSTTHFSEVF